MGGAGLIGSLIIPGAAGSLMDYQSPRHQLSQLAQLYENAVYDRDAWVNAAPVGYNVTEDRWRVTLPKKEVKPMNYVKEYFVKHRELFMGLTVIILLDPFIFKDAFREKLQKIVHGFLDKADKQLNASEKA